jgi:hypothetical protein
MSDVWTYDGYWNTVMGAGRSAADVVNEFDLKPGGRRGLSEWLGTAEAEALRAGGYKDVPDEWREFHATALDALHEAIGD